MLHETRQQAFRHPARAAAHGRDGRTRDLRIARAGDAHQPGGGAPPHGRAAAGRLRELGQGPWRRLGAVVPVVGGDAGRHPRGRGRARAAGLRQPHREPGLHRRAGGQHRARRRLPPRPRRCCSRAWAASRWPISRRISTAACTKAASLPRTLPMPDSTSSPLPYDALIVGGSFAGLSAAMQLARARRRICVVDAGQPRNRFAEASHGFFGHDGAAPLALRDQARAQLLAYPSVDFVADAAQTARVPAGRRGRHPLRRHAGFGPDPGDAPAAAGHGRARPAARGHRGPRAALGCQRAALPLLPWLRVHRPPPRRARQRRAVGAPGDAGGRLGAADAVHARHAAARCQNARAARCTRHRDRHGPRGRARGTGERARGGALRRRAPLAARRTVRGAGPAPGQHAGRATRLRLPTRDRWASWCAPIR